MFVTWQWAVTKSNNASEDSSDFDYNYTGSFQSVTVNDYGLNNGIQFQATARIFSTCKMALTFKG
jgi:hypothetical protein